MQASDLAGVEPLSEGYGLDLARLQDWLKAQLPDCHGRMEVLRFKGGQSNPTMVLSFDGQRRFVLRKKPAGVLLPSAHAVDREYKVISALYGQGVPVARPRLLCEDESLIGTIFYVMDYVEGRSFWEPLLPDMAGEDRAAIYDAMNGAIAALHNADWQGLGLQDFGKPSDYVARQTARWTKQYHASQTRVISAMDNLIDWLPQNIPAQHRSALIHGDYRIDNMIFAADRPEILAILDWELSTIGDPMADFAYHCLTWLLPQKPYRGLGDSDLKALNIPDLRAYRDLYLRRTGQEGVTDRDWYTLLAFCLFRVAAIRQGVMKRVIDGNAVSPHARQAGELAQDVAELGWHFAQKAMTA